MQQIQCHSISQIKLNTSDPVFCYFYIYYPLLATRILPHFSSILEYWNFQYWNFPVAPEVATTPTFETTNIESWIMNNVAQFANHSILIKDI